MENTIVRVATSNNFNCTEPEWEQLNSFSKKNPNKTFFINCNIHTPKLPSISKHPYKVVVTANPNLTITQSGITKVLNRLSKIKNQVAFVRVKYIPDNNPIKNLLTTLTQNNYPVVITMQRFNGKKSLTKFSNPAHYEFSCSRFRLHGPELLKLESFVDKQRTASKPVWICDQAGKGCGGCGLCSRLITGKDLKITSLNLSTSGICPYNCPDCYAKTMQHFSTALGHKPIIFNTIRQNDKQAGRTVHIQKGS
jgi:hypothetical protein